MFKGRVAKIEIDYIPPSSAPVSLTRLNLRGVSGNVLEHDASIRSVTGLESTGYETLGGALSIGGSAYTGARALDREIVFTLECFGPEDGFRNKANSLKQLQDDAPLFFRVTSDRGSTLHTYGYITELTAPPFRKEREIQLTFKSPSPYFVEAPLIKGSQYHTKVRFTDPLQLQQPVYKPDFTTYNDTQYEIDFSDLGVSQHTDIKIAFETSTVDVGYSFAVGGRKVRKVSSLKGDHGTPSGKPYYDSMENRINNHSYVLEGETFDTPVVSTDLTDYGNPKPVKDINTLIARDWPVAYATPEWPSPSLIYPKFHITSYSEASVPDNPILKYRAVIYNKVLGI